MEVLQNTTLWLVLLLSICLLVIWRRWRKAHPRCLGCRKHIRRAFQHCPWCGLPQVHVPRLSPMRQRRRARRDQRAAWQAQEMATMPHKRRRTVVLPNRTRSRTTRAAAPYPDATVLVPPPTAATPYMLICADCETVLDQDDRQCWYCSSYRLTWKDTRKKQR